MVYIRHPDLSSEFILFAFPGRNKVYKSCVEPFQRKLLRCPSSSSQESLFYDSFYFYTLSEYFFSLFMICVNGYIKEYSGV